MRSENTKIACCPINCVWLCAPHIIFLRGTRAMMMMSDQGVLLAAFVWFRSTQLVLPRTHWLPEQNGGPVTEQQSTCVLLQEGLLPSSFSRSPPVVLVHMVKICMIFASFANKFNKINSKWESLVSFESPEFPLSNDIKNSLIY